MRMRFYGRPLPDRLPALDAETWGSWHEHTCVDCGTQYACQAAHGAPLSPTSKTRCEPCMDAHDKELPAPQTIGDVLCNVILETLMEHQAAKPD